MATVLAIIDVLGYDEQYSFLPHSCLTPITQNVDGVGAMSCEHAGKYVSQGHDLLLDYAYIHIPRIYSFE